MACHHPQQFFKIYSSSWQSCASPSVSSVSSYPFSMLRTSTNPLSCIYRDFLPPSSGTYTLSVTSTIYGYSSSTPASVLLIYQNASGIYSGVNQKMTSSQLILTRTGLGSTYSKVTTGFVNRSSSNSYMYYQMAAVTQTSASSSLPIYQTEISPLKQIGL